MHCAKTITGATLSTILHQRWYLAMELIHKAEGTEAQNNKANPSSDTLDTGKVNLLFQDGGESILRAFICQQLFLFGWMQHQDNRHGEAVPL